MMHDVFVTFSAPLYLDCTQLMSY